MQSKIHNAFVSLLSAILVKFAVCLPCSHDQRVGDPQTDLLVIGGFAFGQTDSFNNSVEIINNIASNNASVSFGAPTPEQRYGFAHFMYNNYIYVMGGKINNEIYANFWRYDIKRDEWVGGRDEPPPKLLPMAMFGAVAHAVELPDMYFALIGGENEEHVLYNTSTAYHDFEDRWEELRLGSFRPDPTLFPCTTAQAGQVYYLSASRFYSTDPVNYWTWKAKPHVPRTRAACVAVGMDGVLIVGGKTENDEATNSAELYDVKSDTWKTVAPMNTARMGLAAAEITTTSDFFGNINTLVVVCGGLTTEQDTESSCEIYNVQDDKWTTASFALQQPRAYFAMYALQR